MEHERETGEVRRRNFLKGAAVTAGLAVVPAKAVRGAEANERLRLGIIGCGSRGPWVGRLFEEHTNTKVVALHDYFRDKVDAAGEQFDVPPERRFIGLDGYKALLETDIDAVAIESPPYFHPEQAAAAVAAGKHVYLAKPIAVDVPGCQTIAESAKKAAGKLSFLVDFQTRNNELFREAAKQIHERKVGPPVSGQFFYHTSRLKQKVEPGTEVARLRNWYFDQALSGDIIVEQNIHVLDVATWYLDAHPLKAYGMGGQKARTGKGDCWDHFVVAYLFPDDVKVDFGSTQFLYGYHDMCMRLFCTEGTLDSHYGGEVWIRGNSYGWKGGKTPRIYQDGAVNNMRDFHASILSGEYLNNAEDSVRSTLTSILGREASYANREMTWEEMMRKAERLDAHLDLPEDGPQRKR